MGWEDDEVEPFAYQMEQLDRFVKENSVNRLAILAGTFNNDGKVLHDFVETSVTPNSERKYGKHPTQKPEQLMEHFVSILSDEGNVVLDPFMGSGSVGVAAVRLNRNFIGIELEEKYYSIANSRIVEVNTCEE